MLVIPVITFKSFPIQCVDLSATHVALRGLVVASIAMPRFGRFMCKSAISRLPAFSAGARVTALIAFH